MAVALDIHISAAFKRILFFNPLEIFDDGIGRYRFSQDKVSLMSKFGHALEESGSGEDCSCISSFHEVEAWSVEVLECNVDRLPDEHCGLFMMHRV